MVMPCSRSASSPSTSSAKSMSSPVVPCFARIALQVRDLILHQEMRIVEQPADQRRLAVVDAAAGQEAQRVGGRGGADRLQREGFLVHQK